VKRFAPTTSAELKLKGDKEDVVVAGIISGIRKIITRTSQAEMCVLTLEDMQGKLNVTLFPRTWEQYKDKVEADRVVIVKGKTSHRERMRASEDGESLEVEVMVDELLVLNGEDDVSFSTGNGKVGNGNGKANGKANGNGNGARVYQRLHLDLTGVPSAMLGTLKTLLRHYPGDNPVVVDNCGQRLESALRVSATQEVCQEVARLLGPNAVWLE
jgi:DNA polymerase-3 subunit alpha